MDCLKNYIRIDGCGAPVYDPDADVESEDTETEDEQAAEGDETASGLYINRDLTGISLENIDKLADAEQKTFLGVWNEVQDRGIKKFVIRVKAGYKELFQICDLDDDWFCANKEKLAWALLYFLGGELMFERMYSTRINRFTTIDRSRATELRSEFEQQFMIQLKDALELINDGQNGEGGEIFSFIETLP